MRLSLGQHAIGLLFVGGLADECEIIAVAQTRQDAARKFAAICNQRRSGQMLGIGIDGKPEQHQLNHGDADDHAEGEPVALELNEFLANDTQPSRERKPARVHAAAAVVSSAPAARMR